MGFMDKVKDAGKKAVFGAMLASTKKYGFVVDGKYKGCQVATDAPGEILLFVMVAKENGRHNIREDIASMNFAITDLDRSFFKLTLNFKDGEKCVISMHSDENVGSALPTADQRVAAHHAHIEEFLSKLENKLDFDEQTRANINLIKRYTGKPQI